MTDEKYPRVHVKTTLGAIVIELDEERAPATVANFMDYVREGFYDGTIFHRVIDDFVIQGGGFTPGMNQKPTHAPIENEATNGLRNTRGSIAMARTGNPHSASSQFFINVSDNDFLNHTATNDAGWGYCVFGQVVEGLNVVDQINGMPTTSRLGFKDVPVNDIVIEKMSLLKPR